MLTHITLSPPPLSLSHFLERKKEKKTAKLTKTLFTLSFSLLITFHFHLLGHFLNQILLSFFSILFNPCFLIFVKHPLFHSFSSHFSKALPLSSLFVSFFLFLLSFFWFLINKIYIHIFYIHTYTHL